MPLPQPWLPMDHQRGEDGYRWTAATSQKKSPQASRRAGVQGKELPRTGGFLRLTSRTAWPPPSCLFSEVNFMFVSQRPGRPPSILPSPSVQVANGLKSCGCGFRAGTQGARLTESIGGQISVRKHLSVTKIVQPQKWYPFQNPKHFFLQVNQSLQIFS